MQFAKSRIKDIEYVVKYTPSKQTFTSRNKASHIIGIQLSGSAYHEFSFGGFMLNENTVYFLNQDEDYNVQVKEKGVAFSVHFTTYEKIDTHSFAITVTKNNEIVMLLEKIKNECEGKHRDAVIFSDLYRLINIFDELYKKKYVKSEKGILDAVEYTDTHFKDKDCILNAVKICGVSKRRFNDLFKAITNTTPNKYIIYKKIDYAKKLLELKNISVKEISELCGFSDVYYFSKSFKEVTGYPPSKYLENTY